MAQNCIVCGIVEGRIPSKKVYEDDAVLAVLDVNGSTPGHCFVIPKTHYPIIEHVPDFDLGRMFVVSNKISSAIFQALNVHGTNIFVANGIPAGQTVAHFTINVIPRKENDGVNLLWQPKQLTEEEMSTVELKMKEGIDKAGVIEEPKQRSQSKAAGHSSEDPEEKNEYYIRQMTRIP
ncbi:HIT domain-containing protein [Candidatus Woesearchaeota archaeon]|nr:HIT domain-containing protein [Candidatus Woesearchaeota archaeon]MBI2130869.1 HIT domain-containing protein [Candidatus Woesearchaeota archaeon]MBI2660748.1 HIT domain-containing protein [Candidatus Woesearchaeota archaeon]